MSRNGALNDSDKGLPAGVTAKPPAEYTRPLKGLAITPLGSPDPYAPGAGFVHGWPVAFDRKGGWADLAHCYGTVGVGRDLSPDTGTGGELYAVIGHGPRQLDRNIAIVGRVVEGIDKLSALPRGTEALGFYKDKAQYVPIARIRLASDDARRGASVVRSDGYGKRDLRATIFGYAPTVTTISTSAPRAGSICATSRCRCGEKA